MSKQRNVIKEVNDFDRNRTLFCRPQKKVFHRFPKI